MINQSHLKNVDTELVDELDKLSPDYRDFKNENMNEHINVIHLYPGILINPVIRNIIRIIKKHQDVKNLLDPFMGSGTVLVEGILSGIDNIYGNDLNPLAYLISRVKTTKMHYSDIKLETDNLTSIILSEYNKYRNIIDNIDSHIRNIKGLDITAKHNWGCNAPEYINEYLKNHNSDLKIPDFTNIGYWFLPKVIIELQIIKNCIMKTENDNAINFFWLAYSETVRLVSNRRNEEYKMSRIPVEKLIEYSPDTLNEFCNILNGNLEKMKTIYENMDDDTLVKIYCEDTKELESIPDNSIDLVITSPPYGDSHTTLAYGEFSRLSLQWLGLKNLPERNITDIDKNLLGGTKFKRGFINNLISKTLKNSLEIIIEQDTERAGDVYSFYLDLDRCIESITRKMRVNSYQCWAVENRNVKMVNLKTNKIIEELGKKYGLQHVYTISRETPNKTLPVFNTPNTLSSEKTAAITNSNIVILRKVE